MTEFFRGVIAAASLKHRSQEQALALRAQLLPRRHRRGLIEAVMQEVSRRARDIFFRGVIAAASLKHLQIIRPGEQASDLSSAASSPRPH